LRLIADTVVELVLRLARENVRRADLVRLGGWPCHRCSATPTSPGASNRLEIVLDAVAHPDTGVCRGLRSFRATSSRTPSGTSPPRARGTTWRWLTGVRPAQRAWASRTGFAQFSAGTAPAFRRRGVQSALLAARVADATAAGCELALVTVQPGSRSQRNVQRRGFDLLYTRATLVR